MITWIDQHELDLFFNSSMDSINPYKEALKHHVVHPADVEEGL